MSAHRYAYTIDPNSQTAPARALAQVPSGAIVLELGPGAGSMTRKLREKGCMVTAIERDPECQRFAAPFCDRLILGDLEAPHGWLGELKDTQFDAILACDVLEHLRDPVALLHLLPPLLRENGTLIVTIPNVSHLGIVACLLNDAFDYQDKGLLDATHLRFFTKSSLTRILEASGWVCRHWEAITLPPEYSEFAHYWHRLADPLRHQLLTQSPAGEIYQWLVVATPAREVEVLERANEALARCEEKLRQAQITEHHLQERIAQLEAMLREASALREDYAALQRDFEAMRRHYRQLALRPRHRRLVAWLHAKLGKWIAAWEK